MLIAQFQMDNYAFVHNETHGNTNKHFSCVYIYSSMRLFLMYPLLMHQKYATTAVSAWRKKSK